MQTTQQAIKRIERRLGGATEGWSRLERESSTSWAIWLAFVCLCLVHWTFNLAKSKSKLLQVQFGFLHTKPESIYEALPRRRRRRRRLMSDARWPMPDASCPSRLVSFNVHFNPFRLPFTACVLQFWHLTPLNFFHSLLPPPSFLSLHLDFYANFVKEISARSSLRLCCHADAVAVTCDLDDMWPP